MSPSERLFECQKSLACGVANPSVVVGEMSRIWTQWDMVAWRQQNYFEVIVTNAAVMCVASHKETFETLFPVSSLWGPQPYEQSQITVHYQCGIRKSRWYILQVSSKWYFFSWIHISTTSSGATKTVEIEQVLPYVKLGSLSITLLQEFESTWSRGSHGPETGDL